MPETTSSTGAEGHPRFKPWLLPVIGALLAFVALVAVYYLVFAPLTTSTHPSKGSEVLTTVDVGERLATIRRLMGQGHFRLAVEEANAVEELALQQPEVWSKLQRGEHRQLARQAALMADLLAESLEEVLRHAPVVPEREWQAQFRHRFRAKAVVFDMEVHVLERGRYQHDWRLWVGGERAHLDLNDLELLHSLLPERPPRLLFGARLAEIRREPGRGWVVRLEPNSGVLITDPAVARACFLAPDEAEIDELLKRQASWIQRRAP